MRLAPNWKQILTRLGACPGEFPVRYLLHIVLEHAVWVLSIVCILAAVYIAVWAGLMDRPRRLIVEGDGAD